MPYSGFYDIGTSVKLYEFWDKNVIAVKFITKDSIEEKILKLQQRKSRLAKDIIENVNRGSFSQGDIEFLLD